MRVLYVSEDPALDPDRPASGNQVRAAALTAALEHHGVELLHACHQSAQPGEMEELISQHRPDAIIAGYWKLLESLPETMELPVVADCIAPRPLEQHFDDKTLSDLYIARYLRALDRADVILVANARQRWMMAAWMIAGGFDLTGSVPIIETPLGIAPRPNPRDDHHLPLILTAGGHDWPWRDSRRWLQALVESQPNGQVELHCFGNGGIDHPAAWHHEITAWRNWKQFLEGRAHVGVELSDMNIEREMSQSFRATACIEAGLPLILNRGLPLAGRVEEYKAGWVVDHPDQAAEAVDEAVRDPQAWRDRAAGAWRLGRECLEHERSVAGLVEWLQNPRQRRRRAAPQATAMTGSMERRPSLTGMVARALLKPFMRRIEGDGVVVISRSDLFPTDHGAAVKIVETARGLARLGRAVAIVTSERSHYYRVGADEITRHRLPWWLAALAMPRALSHLLHRLRGLPASNAFLYWPLTDPSYGLRAAWVGRHIGASTCLAEFPGYAQSARICRLFNGGRAVLAEHNVEYQRLADQLEDLTRGQFEKLKRIELALANCMDAVVCVSDPDRRQLIDDGLDPAAITTIPHGVDLPAFDQAAVEDLSSRFGLDPDRPVLVYHGTYSYPPNRQALLVMIDELLPRLARLGQRPQILAIGSDAPRALDHPDVCMPGSLPELAGTLKACDLAIVPLVSGGGTRMKILDYFAAARAVISTSKGCEGLPVVDGSELLIRDDWDDFAAAVATLLEDAGQRERIARGGRRLAESLDWLEISRRYDRLFKRIRTGAASDTELTGRSPAA